MSISSNFRITRLILVGHRKNYTIPFHPGVNIIYGDADTGKSSILRIIYYLLGSKSIQLDHEISTSVQYAVLELFINGTQYCIKRDIFDSNRLMEVYQCSFDEIGNHFPAKYSPSLGDRSSDTISFSEFLINELNYPYAELKQAPTKDDSALARLSIRDLFKFCYLNQDSVGSRKIFNIGNPVVEVKNKEVFKYIFNTLDSNITDLDAEISSKTNKRNELTHKLKVVTEFLDETEFDSSETIDKELAEIRLQRQLLESRLNEIKGQIINNSETYKSFQDVLRTIKLKISQHEASRAEFLRNIERFDRLKNDYQNDIRKLKSIDATTNLIGADAALMTTCPICDSQMNVKDVAETFTITEKDKVRHEVNSLSRRIKDLSNIVLESREKVAECSAILGELYEERDKANNFMDEESANTIGPYLAERDTLISEISYTVTKEKQLLHELKVINQHGKIAEKIGQLTANIDLLKEKLSNLKDAAPSMKEILASLGEELDAYLEKIHIKTRTGISISEKSFLPVVRGTEYRHINSGGMRTIVSIGYLAILMKAGLDINLNLPSFLMVDTVGKYLGKTTENNKDTNIAADLDENISDPNKYKNIYEYLIDLAEDYDFEGKECQIILVDNDVPHEITTKYKGFVIAHYSSDGANGLPVGLIDDWDEFVLHAGLEERLEYDYVSAAVEAEEEPLMISSDVDDEETSEGEA